MSSGRRTHLLVGINPSRVFYCLALLLLPLMVDLSFDFGYTWDEKRQQKQGEEVWDYLDGARDRSVLEGNETDQLYSELFDVVCIAVEKVVPRSDTYVVRHAVNAVFGWFAVLACGLLARSLFGDATGILAMLLLVSWPPFLGHSMNNPKDVPFAAFFALGCYYIMKVSASYPYVTWRHAAKLTVAFALVVRRFATAALCLALLEPLVFDVRNNPNEAVYFNAFVGGPAGAFGRYDLDYWGNCALQAVAWSDHLAGEAHAPIVLSGGNSAHAELDAHRFGAVTYQPYVRGRNHLVIQILRGPPKDLREAVKSALFLVQTADGAPLCAVQRGPM